MFVNTSGGGFVAQVSESVTPEMKTIGGRLAYLIGGAQALMEFEPVRMTLVAEPGPSQPESVHLAAWPMVDESLVDEDLIEATDLNEALQVAGKIPSAKTGSVEVRPIVVF